MAVSEQRHQADVFNEMLKFSTAADGFHKNLKKVAITQAGPEGAVAQFEVQPEHLNSGGNLHGAFIALLVDDLTSYALAAAGAPLDKLGVSVSISVTYMRAAAAGELVTVTATPQKRGRSLTFSTVQLHNSSGELIAQGQHTKFVAGSDSAKAKL